MNGLIHRIDGLVIDKSTAFQTICQTIKYQTIYPAYTPYHRYKGLSIPSIYRRKMGGYINDTPIPLWLYNKPYMADTMA